MKIAACLIVKNEEALLSRCLDSVKGFDEIIVCDTGSTDSTVEIAKKYTDKVFTDYTWEDSFCKARNHAKSKVSKGMDWILTIDADEYLENTYEQVKIVVEQARAKVVNTKLIDERTGVIHTFPRLYRNVPEVFWVNDVHNLLNTTSREHCDISIVYGYSPAHKKDPDRAMRILLKSLSEDPKKVRERYYLAREYCDRKWWQKAIDMYDHYIEDSSFLSERNDAWLMRARCLAKLKKYDETCDNAWQAIKYNANFKEALIFVAKHMDWGNADRWLSFAEMADNRNVLFDRTSVKEKGPKYYDKNFELNGDMSRYENILIGIGKLVGKSSVLDIGCGLAKLAEYIEDYTGFDFSKYAIESAKENFPDKKFFIGDAYKKGSYKKADVYVATEVLEHVDDLKVLRNIPSGQRFIFSVPSFTDPSHVRIYTEDLIRMRLPIKIKSIERFNWNKGRWDSSHKPTVNYILLVDSVKL